MAALTRPMGINVYFHNLIIEYKSARVKIYLIIIWKIPLKELNILYLLDNYWENTQ